MNLKEKLESDTKKYDSLFKQLSNEWDLIPEEEPDEWDKEMLQEIEQNPDCRVFISEQELDFRRSERSKKTA